jgi:hypothetical protein
MLGNSTSQIAAALTLLDNKPANKKPLSLEEAKAELDLAISQVQNDNEEEELEVVKKLADAGNSVAQYTLAVFYGDECNKDRDKNKTIIFLQRAADQGHAEAQFHLGIYYLKGRSVTQDVNRGFAWIKKAAKQGHAGAQAFLNTLNTYPLPNKKVEKPTEVHDGKPDSKPMAPAAVVADSKNSAAADILSSKQKKEKPKKKPLKTTDASSDEKANILGKIEDLKRYIKISEDLIQENKRDSEEEKTVIDKFNANGVPSIKSSSRALQNYNNAQQRIDEASKKLETIKSTNNNILSQVSDRAITSNDLLSLEVQIKAIHTSLTEAIEAKKTAFQQFEEICNKVQHVNKPIKQHMSQAPDEIIVSKKKRKKQAKQAEEKARQLNKLAQNATHKKKWSLTKAKEADEKLKVSTPLKLEKPSSETKDYKTSVIKAHSIPENIRSTSVPSRASAGSVSSAIHVYNGKPALHAAVRNLIRLKCCLLNCDSDLKEAKGEHQLLVEDIKYFALQRFLLGLIQALKSYKQNISHSRTSLDATALTEQRNMLIHADWLSTDAKTVEVSKQAVFKTAKE